MAKRRNKQSAVVTVEVHYSGCTRAEAKQFVLDAINNAAENDWSDKMIVATQAVAMTIQPPGDEVED